MKQVNVVAVYHPDGKQVLLCYRRKPPYQGLYNLIGGKVEAGETPLAAAYRELREETGITEGSIRLVHVMDAAYYQEGVVLQCFAGRLTRDVPLREELNPLQWMARTENFFDDTRFAGKGNIGHLLLIAEAEVPGLRCPLPDGRRVRLDPLGASDIPLLSANGPDDAKWQGLLADTTASQREGRFFEQLCIRDGETIVGVLSLAAQEDGVIRESLEIFPAYRRMGYGRKAVTLAMERARMLGYTEVSAKFCADDEANLALHRSLGFMETACGLSHDGQKMDLFRRRVPARHDMQLRPKPFAAMASGRKRFELRLNDEKRRRIQTGDLIAFHRTEGDATLLARVILLRPFADFTALYAALPLMDCGYTAEALPTASPRDMEAYYPLEKQAEMGVLAIEVEVLSVDGFVD